MATLNKKHFEMIADVLKKQVLAMSWDAYEELVQDMADVCAKANPLFNYSKFREACGVRNKEKQAND